MWKAEEKHFKKLLKGDSSVGPEEKIRAEARMKIKPSGKERMRELYQRRRVMRKVKQGQNLNTIGALIT
jgi:hypothetical protein